MAIYSAILVYESGLQRADDELETYLDSWRALKSFESSIVPLIADVLPQVLTLIA